MAVSSIANLFSFFTPSKPPTPKTALLQFCTDSLSSSSPNQEGNLLPLISTNDHNYHIPLPLSSSSLNSDITSVVCPSLAYANTLFFRSAYNVQVIVDDNEHEEKLIGRFRREVMRAGVIQECKRRRFYENAQDKDKRKTHEAAKRNRRRRGPPPSRNFGQDKQQTYKNKRNDDDGDNWELPDGVGELAVADVKPPVITLQGIEKVGRIIEVLKNTTHNGFPAVDGAIPELHELVLRTHPHLVLKKKWFLNGSRRREEWEVEEKFTWIDLAENWGKIADVAVTKDEMEMYVDLHPLINTTPYTAVESMSVAKVMVAFRQVALRHMIIVPKYQAAGVFPVVGILTRQDLRACNILNVSHLAKSKPAKRGTELSYFCRSFNLSYFSSNTLEERQQK